MKSQIFDGILSFFLWSPQWNEGNTSCLNELKLCEVSWNPKSSVCWKLYLSNSKIDKSPQKSGSTFPNRGPLFKKVKKNFQRICKSYIFFQVTNEGSSSHRRTCDPQEPVSILSNKFAKRVTPDCFHALLSLIKW